MATNCAARRTLQMASSSTTKLASSCLSSSLSPPFAFVSKATKLNGFPSIKSNSPRRLAQKLSSSISTLPKELAGLGLSFNPLHSVPASALFTSLLSLHNRSWGCLSEGFATPL